MRIRAKDAQAIREGIMLARMPNSKMKWNAILLAPSGLTFDAYQHEQRNVDRKRIMDAYMDTEKRCFACGHKHPAMAHASNGIINRSWCHEDDHSCYNDYRGRYFEDL